MSTLSKEELECWQLNFEATNLLWRSLSHDVQELVYRLWSLDAHINLELIKDLYNEVDSDDEEESNDELLEECSTSSNFSQEPNMISLNKEESQKHQSKKKKNKSKKGEIQKIEESSSSAKEIDLLKANYASLVCKYESLEKDYTCATQSLSCVAFYKKSNEMLIAQLDKITSEHKILQANYKELECSHEKLVESYATLDIAHEDVLSSVKSIKPLSHQCTCSLVNNVISCSNSCAQASQSSIEHVFVETCDDRITQENQETMQENKVEENNKLEHIKCSHCSTLGHYAFSCPTKLKGEKTLSKKKRSLFKKRVCYGCKEKGHLIAMCPNVTSVDATGDRRLERLSRPVRPPVTQGEPHQGSNKKEASPSTHKPINKQDQLIQKVKVTRKVKCRICYTCRQKGHVSKDCPNGNTLKSDLIQYDFNRLGRDKDGTCATREISPQTSIRTIWIPKHLVTNLYGPNKVWVPKNSC
ncbi:hypothetical protein HU200_011522 [Digitaria exilis]|uniref:CCHC-type domain-containing protein n=1 Tax=Digitaria exilis TaxID=1010633 RepID=A0A835KMM1_9POAL|nr:hypothetical protein HU200_011522 [Digitaria exilis]